ncbi:MAG: hypothetical protein WAU78_13160 [Roseiarcus sp.]
MKTAIAIAAFFAFATPVLAQGADVLGGMNDYLIGQRQQAEAAQQQQFQELRQEMESERNETESKLEALRMEEYNRRINEDMERWTRP